MKKMRIWGFAILVAFALCACGKEQESADIRAEEADDYTTNVNVSDTSDDIQPENDVAAADVLDTQAGTDEITVSQISMDDLLGEWELDGNRTEADLQGYSSLQEMFGTGIASGSSMHFFADGSMGYYIGIGNGGEGSYEFENLDSGVDVTVQVTPYENHGSDDEALEINCITEDDELYLVMEYYGEQLYWKRKNVSDDVSGIEPENNYIMVENPSEEYYCQNGTASNENKVIKLDMLTEEENAITDTEKWFENNNLEKVDTNVIYDDKYRYVLTGDDGYSKYLMDIYDKVSGEYLKTFDFSQYRYANEYKEADYNYIEQRIWWVQSINDILYVAIGHNTYTDSCPNHGYMVALDINDAGVLWKSAPCMTNARNFAIIDNTIVCGYGFTSEPDNLNLLNIEDGTLIEQIPVKTMADYIICKDDVLYVRTYNTNYTFKIVRE